MSVKPKFDIEIPKTPQQIEQEKQIIEIKKRLIGKSLFVATPMFGGVCHGLYAKGINELLVNSIKLGVEVRTSNIYNESLINRARNYLLQSFLDSDSTHILWIDADISFNSLDVFTLLAYCDEVDPTTGKTMDIVGALYPKKSIAADKIVAAVKAGLCDNNPDDIFKYGADLVVNPVLGGGSVDVRKPIQVSEIGTGFMLMSRESVNMMRRKNARLKYTPDHVRTAGFDGTRQIYNLFEVGIDSESNRLLSEDYGFLKIAREVGLSIFAFPWIKLTHIGNWFFQGDLPAMAVFFNKISDEYHVSMSGPLMKKEKPSENSCKSENKEVS